MCTFLRGIDKWSFNMGAEQGQDRCKHSWFQDWHYLSKMFSVRGSWKTQRGCPFQRLKRWEQLPGISWKRRAYLFPLMLVDRRH